MSTIEENLRTYVLGSTEVAAAIGSRMHQNTVHEGSELPFVWYARSTESIPRDLSGGGGITQTRFDLECVSDDLAEADSIGRAIRTRVDGYFGTMGDARCKGCFVEDKDDQYLPKSGGQDAGLHVIALGLNLWHT